ncbi:hypothetical protein ACP4OV_019764 [Aristida adscensionis]
MANLLAPVQWWEEWQLRLLVLASIFLQFFLFFSISVRTYRIPSWYRSCIWLAYLGADAVAIYSLATLFSRHKPSAASGTSSVLEVLWAPVLLIHLGGQHMMTAYSIEDNELWVRHIVTLVSQVTVALYVFCRSWPGGDKKLLQTAILLFVVGILKFIQKPWALKSASINSVITSSTVYPSRTPSRGKMIFSGFMSFIRPFSVIDGLLLKEEEEQDLPLEQYVHDARKLVLETEVDNTVAGSEGDSFYIEKLFVDISPPYSRRLRKLQYFLKLDHRRAYNELQRELSVAFGFIYTNVKVVRGSFLGCVLHNFLPYLVLTAAALFTKSHKDIYNKSDVKVAYILIWLTTILELLPLYCPCFTGLQIPSISVSQHNLLTFYARESKPTKLMKFSTIICCKDYINMHWYIEQASASASFEIANLVIQHVKEGFNLYMTDSASYRRYNNFRGQWTMGRHNLLDTRLWKNLPVQFDQCILVWHIATELCLHHLRTSQAAATRCGQIISKYMIYLLSIRPEMLMPGTRQGLFTNASYDIEQTLKYLNEPPSQDERAIVQRILQTAQSPSEDFGISVPKACKLAEDLMELLADERERWKVIEGMWVEMLCYSASRCRGYLHAKSMGEGLELLTFVWLLLSRMGMENFADKFQRSEAAETHDMTIV